MSQTLLLLLVGCGDKDDTSVAVEADADTDADTDTDTDPPWPDDTADWSHCPDASAYVGDDGWSGSLLTTEDAFYCSAWNEDRTLEEEAEVLGRARIVAGDWALPTDEGSADLTLPLCVARPDGFDVPTLDGDGSTTVSLSSFSGTTYTYLTGSQDLTDGWSLDHTLVMVGDKGAVPDVLSADGGPNDADTGAGMSLVLVPSGSSALSLDSLTFATCGDPAWVRNTHTVTFDGGEVTLTLWLGNNVVATAPGRFSEADGSLDGTAFSQTDDFKLVYNPGRHHFERHFAVIFDEPIGDACGIRIEDLDGIDDGVTGTVSTMECDLTVLESREVTAETFTEK